MRNALVIVIVCLSVSLLYDVYKEPIDRLLHLDQTETNETAETGNRKQKTKKQAQKPDGQQEEGLPSAYDGRMTGKAPEVKNQGTFGTCWAVVTSSALESRLLPQEDIIFSADHISTQNSYAIGQEEGGAYNIAIAYLTAWQGPVTEEMDPYGDGVTPEGLSPVKHVQEVQIAEDKDFDAIFMPLFTVFPPTVISLPSIFAAALTVTDIAGTNVMIRSSTAITRHPVFFRKFFILLSSFCQISAIVKLFKNYSISRLFLQQTGLQNTMK